MHSLCFSSKKVRIPKRPQSMADLCESSRTPCWISAISWLPRNFTKPQETQAPHMNTFEATPRKNAPATPIISSAHPVTLILPPISFSTSSSVAKNAGRCWTASFSSSPSAVIVTTVPWVSFRVCSLKRLFAFPDLPLAVTVISEGKCFASLTNCAAGRLSGEVVVVSSSYVFAGSREQGAGGWRSGNM